MSASDTHAARDRLFEDIKTIVTDAEELLKATAGQSGEKIESVRARAEDNLRRARVKLGEMEGDVVDRTRAAAKATDQLVHENPWQSIALAAAVGFVFGMMSGRR